MQGDGTGDCAGVDISPKVQVQQRAGRPGVLEVRRQPDGEITAHELKWISENIAGIIVINYYSLNN